MHTASTVALSDTVMFYRLLHVVSRLAVAA